MTRGYVDDFGQRWVTRDDHKQALAEKDKEIDYLKEKVAHYDRWLSQGVYFTNEEFSEQVLKPNQQLMEQAVRFARCITGCPSPCVGEDVKDCAIWEAQAFLKEREERDGAIMRAM